MQAVFEAAGGMDVLRRLVDAHRGAKAQAVAKIENWAAWARVRCKACVGRGKKPRGTGHDEPSGLQYLCGTRHWSRVGEAVRHSPDGSSRESACSSNFAHP